MFTPASETQLRRSTSPSKGIVLDAFRPSLHCKFCNWFTKSITFEQSATITYYSFRHLTNVGYNYNVSCLTWLRSRFDLNLIGHLAVRLAFDRKLRSIIADDLRGKSSACMKEMQCKMFSAILHFRSAQMCSPSLRFSSVAVLFCGQSKCFYRVV